MRRLELTAPEDALVRRATTLLEDAFRTSSLPGADDDRVVLVRRLDLGAFHVSESPSAIALEAERRFEALATAAVLATEPTAASASIVFFRDDVEPCILLAERVARGDPASEWFWPLAVRGWSAALARDAGLRLLLFRALETSSGAAGAVRLVRQLVAHGAAELLLVALRPEDGLAFLRACGWSHAVHAGAGETAPQLGPHVLLGPNLNRGSLETRAREPAPEPALIPPFGEPLDRASLELLGRWTAAWGPLDARTTWLAHVLVVASRPGWLGSTQLAELAAGAVRAAVRQPTLPPATAKPDSAHTGRRTGAATEVRAAPRCGVVSHREASAGTTPPGNLPASALPARLDSGSGGAALVTGATGPWNGAPVQTPHAGLLFLVPLLQRLGMDALLRERPELIEREFALRLLRRVAALLGLSADDPAVTVLPPPSDGSLDFEASERGLAARWVGSMRKWCLREAAFTLRALVRRSGRIATTPTHIDVLFDHRQADVRIRMAGLDVDPGWVPWLDRVVHFHYSYGELARAE